MPTQKQLLAAEKIVENHGNVSKGMLDAGYTPATAKNPSNLTTSKGFASITEELQHELGDIKVTPKRLARVIKQGLAAKQPGKIIIIEKSPDGTTDVKKKTIEVPDHAIRHRFLDTSLKVLGAYPEDKSPTSAILAAFKSLAPTYIDPDPPEAEVVDGN